MMKRKIYTLIVTLLMISSATLIIIPNNLNVKADPGEGEGDGIGLDFQLIHEITENLSQIVNTSYDVENGDLPKGRFFGSSGEQDAAYYLNFTFNDPLGINAYMDRIDNNNDFLQVNKRNVIIKCLL